MKRIIPILIGFAPLPLGFLLNDLMINRDFLPPLLMGFLFLFAWFLFGMLSIKFVTRRKEAVLLLNTPAFLVLLLILFQEIILGRFFANIIGISSQFFYLPLMQLGAIIVRVTGVITISGSASVAFVLMLIASYLGRRVAERAKE